MLNLLIEYAHKHDLTVEPGFKPKQVRWAIVCDADGNYLQVIELGDKDQDRTNGKRFSKCPDLSQPEMKRAGPGSRHFLVDTAAVVALYGKDSNDQKLHEKHAYFVKLLRLASESSPELKNIAAMIEKSDVVIRLQQDMKERNAKETDNVTFAVSDSSVRFPVDFTTWHDWWRAFRHSLTRQDEVEGKKTSRKIDAKTRGGMRCLASGELVEPASTHPKIEGLSDVGGLSMGDSLASFKQDAFQSYGLSQSHNAPVSEEMAVAYRAGLNDLIKSHGRRLAGAKIVHWYSGSENVKEEDDPLAFLLGEVNPKQEELVAQNRARLLLEALRAGKRPDLAHYRYFVLTLSGVSGRVMVRDWTEGQFDTLVEHIDKWFEDLAIIHSDGMRLAYEAKFMAVLGGLVRELKDLSPPLVTKMWRVAVKHEPIPLYAMVQALARTRVDIMKDKTLLHARMGLLKAYHIRQGDKNMLPHLNEDHPHPAYHCGRLMAVLADLQHAALGDVGAGIIQRYYASASATPALVLGNLTRLGQFHLNKLSERGLAFWYDNQIARIWSCIGEGVPKTLTLEEQSLFALGYYQQKASRGGSAKQSVQIAENTEVKKS